jgi:hypothetical protein
LELIQVVAGIRVWHIFLRYDGGMIFGLFVEIFVNSKNNKNDAVGHLFIYLFGWSDIILKRIGF